MPRSSGPPSSRLSAAASAVACERASLPVSGPVVAVVIVAYRSEETIEACLRSALAADEPLDRLRDGPSGGNACAEAAPVPDAPAPEAESRALEVVVVDNASGDGTVAKVLRFGRAVRLIPNPDNRGFSRAVNQGIGSTTAPFVFLLNPDSRVEPDSLATLVRFLVENPEAGVCGPKILSPDGSTQLSCRAFPNHSTALFHRHALLTRLFPHNPHSNRYLKTRWDHSRLAQVDWVSGAAMMLRRSALDRIGRMDEDYFLYCEDVDLCWRLGKRGWGTFFVPEAVVWHDVGCSARQTPYRALIERHRSMYTFYKKHYSQDIPLIDFATFLGIALRCLLFVGLAASGGSVGHHGDEKARPRRRQGKGRQAG